MIIDPGTPAAFAVELIMIDSHWRSDDDDVDAGVKMV